MPQFQRFPQPGQFAGGQQNPLLQQQQQAGQKPGIDPNDLALARRQLLAANASQASDALEGGHLPL